jgi:hypothetical protein
MVDADGSVTGDEHFKRLARGVYVVLVVLLECQHTCMPQWPARDNTSSHNWTASTTPVTMHAYLEIYEAVPSQMMTWTASKPTLQSAGLS